jgi:hypothetical protein
MTGELCELRDCDLALSLDESRNLLANLGVSVGLRAQPGQPYPEHRPDTTQHQDLISAGNRQAWRSATSRPSSARTQATISVVGAPGVKILATPIR